MATKHDKSVFGEVCPVCLWVMGRDAVRMLRFPMDCPGCGARKSNEFVVMTIREFRAKRNEYERRSRDEDRDGRTRL